MTKEVFDMALEKAMYIMPIQLEIAKLEGQLTSEERSTLRNELQESDVGKQLSEELNKLVQKEISKKTGDFNSSLNSSKTMKELDSDVQSEIKNMFTEDLMSKEIFEEIIQKDSGGNGGSPSAIFNSTASISKLIIKNIMKKAITNPKIMDAMIERSFIKNPPPPFPFLNPTNKESETKDRNNPEDIEI
jgi:hypothetical protein